jgi:hypothetical protein
MVCFEREDLLPLATAGDAEGQSGEPSPNVTAEQETAGAD